MSKSVIKRETQPMAASLASVLRKSTNAASDGQVEPVNRPRTASMTLKEQAKLEGRAEGFREGFEHGRVQAFNEAQHAYRLEIRAFADELSLIEGRVAEALQQWSKEAEERLGVLALVIAEKLIGAELAVSRETIVATAAKAVQEATLGTRVRIRVNPFDLGLVDSRRGEILAAASHLQDIEIVADPAILGGCMVESDAGVVDARIEAMLAKLATIAGVTE